LPHGFDAVQNRHSDVDNDDVGAQPHRHFHKIAPILSASDNLKPAFQYFPEARQKYWMIVSQD
jgi:hypothetical protein